MRLVKMMLSIACCLSACLANGTLYIVNVSDLNNPRGQTTDAGWNFAVDTWVLPATAKVGVNIDVGDMLVIENKNSEIAKLATSRDKLGLKWTKASLSEVSTARGNNAEHYIYVIAQACKDDMSTTIDK